MNPDKTPMTPQQTKALQEAKDRVAKRYTIPVPEHSEMAKAGIKEVECSGWEQLLHHVREGNNRDEIINKLTDEAMLEYASSSSGQTQDVSFSKLNEWLDGMIKICKDNPPPPDIKRDGELEVLLKLKNLLPDLFTRQSSKQFDVNELLKWIGEQKLCRPFNSSGDLTKNVLEMVEAKIQSLIPKGHSEGKGWEGFWKELGFCPFTNSHKVYVERNYNPPAKK